MRGRCGGCEGKGAHWRWCPASAGPTASLIGPMADRAEQLGDAVGPNNYGVANALWRAAASLRAQAEAAKREFQASH